MLGYSYIDLSAPEQDARRLALDSLGHYTILSQLAILILASSYQFLFCPWRPRVQSAFLRKLEWRLMTPLSWSSRESKSLADWGVMWGWFGWMFWLVVREAGNGAYNICLTQLSKAKEEEKVTNYRPVYYKHTKARKLIRRTQ